jgi:hypothetical protein
VNGRWDCPEFEPSRPLPAKGGIAARSRRGAIGEQWWSQRFIHILESFGVGSRLKRGRTYARDGQVIELDVEPGIALAKVQGSRYTPYKVRIRTKVLSDAQWRRAEKAMSEQALPLAKLLAGEMPHEIEQVFTASKLALFPTSASELKARPDRAHRSCYSANRSVRQDHNGHGVMVGTRRSSKMGSAVTTVQPRRRAVAAIRRSKGSALLAGRLSTAHASPCSTDTS